MQRLSLFLLALASSISAYAVRLPAVINSNMVLQRDMQVPIWGWGDAGEKISVHFAGQKKETTAGKNGEWMVKLDKLKANASPSVLTVKGNNEIKLENVLVGEVWICSGQSNMEWRVQQCANPKEEIANANHGHRFVFLMFLSIRFIPSLSVKVTENGKCAHLLPSLSLVQADTILEEGFTMNSMFRLAWWDQTGEVPVLSLGQRSMDSNQYLNSLS